MSKHHTHRTWWNRLLSGLLCLALALGLLPPAGLIQTAGAYWADPYGKLMVDWGIMKSSSDLRLGDTTTRAEFVAMLNRAFGYSRRGNMPFTDVSPFKWYAQDINIAYNAGYFKGISSKKASPETTLTREEAVVMLARCVRLQETVGEGLNFTDSRDLHDWSHGLVSTAESEGIVNGYTDGSFRPANAITRGEVAKMLVRVIGTPINKAGSYDELAGGVVYGNVTISSSNVTLRNTIVDGDLYITGGVDLGNVLLENVTVLGRIIVAGGGESHEGQSSIALRNVEAKELTVDSMVNQFVTISAYGLTDIPNTFVRSTAYLEDSCAEGYGLHYIELAAKKGTKLQLAGKIKEVKNKTPLSLLQLVQGTAEKITIDEYATGSELLISYNTVVQELNLDVATRVYGQGDIINLFIGADGCEVEIIPEHVDIRAGIRATLGEGDDKRDVGSTEASELSSEPRLLPGYPGVTNRRPTQAEGLYAVNKPGKIYWAVSAIADGSVSVEDLIKNPSYGGNILKDGEVPQSGSIDASARIDYSRLITGLEKDGSYYISAVLVDERGNRSPLKVISFSTPDDTVPEFVTDPYMSKVSCEVAQVTAMANKSCTLYWVLLEAGAAPPTASNFKTGSFGGHYGYGLMSVVKNVPVSIQVNSGRLQEKTGYDLYLWLNDLDGTKNSGVIKVVNASGNASDPSFITPDETPPYVTSINQTNYNLPDAIEFDFTINEAPSKLYWAVVTATDNTFMKTADDLTSLRGQLKMKNGTGSIVHNVMDARGAEETTTVGQRAFENKLSYAKYGTHNFKLYYMAEDADGNCSEIRYIDIYTLDNEEPTVTVTFSSAKYSTEEDKKANRNPMPQSDTSITLTFSEQIKGDDGTEPKDFVELYNEVVSYSSDYNVNTGKEGAQLKAAKDALAKALAEHITLYYLKDNTERPGTSKPGTPLNSDKSKDFGWLDLREATVVQQSDGKVEITLTNGKAVQLGGGMRYYFFFENIFDISYAANPLKLTRSDGSTDGGITNNIPDLDCYTEIYTTVYAQVWMQFMDDNVEEVNGDDIRMDILVDVWPEALSDTADEAYWDMIMWCDTSVDFELYLQIGNGAWEKVFGPTSYGPNSMNGVSLIAQKDDDPKPMKIGDTLHKDGKYTTYHYGIHFTSVNGAAEDNTKRDEPLPTWSEKVTMWFSIITGASSAVKNAARNVKANFDADRKLINSNLSEIGADYDKDTETKLEAYHQFRNTAPPTFYDTYPEFTPTSNTITMEVAMDDSSGWLYWVAAPVKDGRPSIPTSTGDGKAINGSNDKNSPRTDSGNSTTPTDMTYIPKNGEDRNSHKADIYYMSGGNKSGSAPGFRWITEPKDYLAQAKGVVWGGPVEVGRAAQEIVIPDLEPNTKYYIYIVLQGNGDATSVTPEIYQVTTDEAHPPVITIDPGASNEGIKAEITTLDGAPIGSSNTKRGKVNSELNWALVNWANLPAFFQYTFEYTPAGATAKKTSTLINMLVNRTGSANNSPTLFDEYAANATLTAAADGYTTSTKASEFTDKIMDFIKNEGDFDAETERPVDWGTDDYSASGDPVSPKFKNVPEDNYDVEYGILVFARVDGAGDEIANYSFAAAKGMYMPDKNPPVFVPQTKVESDGVTSYVRVTDIKAYNADWSENTGWRELATSDKTSEQAKLLNLRFNGKITITFSKTVYQFDGGVRKEVVANGATSNQVNLANVTSKPSGVTLSVTKGASDDGKSVIFEIAFTGLHYGESLTILSSGRITNASPAGVVSDKRLTLVFNPLITAGKFGDTFLPNMITGGFVATWADVPSN